MFESGKYIQNAIEFCLVNTGSCSNKSDIIAALKTQDSLVHSNFRYSIAKDIAVFLFSRFSKNIKALKLYGSTMDYTAGIYSDIDLIVHVDCLSSELKDTLEQLNSFLTYEYFCLLGETPGQWDYLIDIHIINDDPGESTHPSKAYLQYILENNSLVLC